MANQSDDAPQPVPASDVVFSASVKAVQEARGSRAMFAAREARGQSMHREFTEDLAGFIGLTTTCFLATASATGQPSVQHRGGPPGFLKVLDGTTVAFADFAGNKQFVSTGNILENPKVALILMDYMRQQRVKIWGEAQISNNPDLIAALMPENYRARPLQALVIRVAAWDINCAQHIPQMFAAEDVGETLTKMQARIDALEAEVKKLRPA